MPDLSFATLGNFANPPALLLHGFMGCGRDWLPIAQPLSQNYFCILPDLFSSNIDFSFETLTADLRALLDTLGVADMIVIGYSLGGRVALSFACAQPQRVRALILESTHPGITDPADRQARAALDDRRAQMILSRGLDAFVDQWYQMGLWHSLKQHPKKLAAMKAARKANDPETTARVIRQLSPGRMPPRWACLPSLAMPALLVAGGLDAKYAALAPQAAARMPHARVHIIPNAGHNAHAEQPDIFLDGVQKFLSALNLSP